MHRLTTSLFVVTVLAAACARSPRQAPLAPAPPPAPVRAPAPTSPAAPPEPVEASEELFYLDSSPKDLGGYLGNGQIVGEVVQTDVGWRGCLRLLGTSEPLPLTVTLGKLVPREPGCPECADQYDRVDVPCTFELGSGGNAIHKVGARCSKFVIAESPLDHGALEIQGEAVRARGGMLEPFFFGEMLPAAGPDEMIVALAASARGSHACAPFIALLETRALPDRNRAVLFTQRFPCEEPTTSSSIDFPRRPSSAELWLATFDRGVPPRVIESFAVPGGMDSVPSLALYALSPEITLYSVTFTYEGESAGGRFWANISRRLFARIGHGNPGPPVELPDANMGSGCDPFDETEVRFARRGGRAIPDVVVELVHVRKPCSESADEPDEPNVSEFTSYRFDPKTTELVLQKLSSRRLAMKGTKGVGVLAKDLTAADTPLNAPADLARAVCPELQ